MASVAAIINILYPLSAAAIAIRHDCPSSDGSVLSSMNSSSSFSNTASRCPSNSNPSILWSGWVLAGYGGLSVVELTVPYLYPTLMVRSADPISLPAVVVLEGVGRDIVNRCRSMFIPFIDWRWWRDGGESEIKSAACRLQRRLRVQERSRSQIEVMVLQSSSC